MGARLQAGVGNRGCRNQTERSESPESGRDLVPEEPKLFCWSETAVCTVLIGAACGRGTSKTRLVTLQGLPYRLSPPPPPPPPPGPLPTFAPVINAEPQRPLEQESKISGHLDQEPSLHYADLDHSVLGRHRRMSTVVSGDASTVYAVVV